MIEVENVTKDFGLITVLDGISFSAQKGQVVGLLGPNGAGKTTLIRILTCFLPPSTGVAKVCGMDVTSHSLDIRRKIGYFPERAPLYVDMRVKDFLLFVAEVKGVKSRDRKKVISEAIELCSLNHMVNRIIGNLSKGYRQRVGLAQALIKQPEVLILDEPTIGLDPEQVIEIRKLIKDLAGERTILLSSHILSEVSLLCSKIIIVDKGRTIADDTPENLRTLLQGDIVTKVQIEGDRRLITRELEKVKGVFKVSAQEKKADDTSEYLIKSDKSLDFCKELSALAIKNAWILREVQTLKLSLEDIFLSLIAQAEDMKLKQ